MKSSSDQTKDFVCFRDDCIYMCTPAQVGGESNSKVFVLFG